MDVEIGIQNVTRPVSFATDKSADEVSAAISEAVGQGTVVDLTDVKGRRIVIPGKAIGYAIVGSETSHPVGFGALG
ncbi:DUF3107 domain-containing protein [Bifidobacterium catulorum]|uniref:DUF3107 domain-containing protein n=1 Tax=Bifidobacterium catulorum TaxID=1630173 RepID=A0A2U2MS56_9BIFI|nr:DUF3107 domain-containing protein [Bifidobacterium catulorum]PWG59698.1 DUF3107 domain-containing protein [Bifidobacterium catulorum]